MEMIRKFHPIGQGAFYTEKFKTAGEQFNVVYDCGTLNQKKILETNLKKAFKKGEKIDIVFISHFHSDHINCLDYLLDYCDVKNIIIPYIDNSNKIFSELDNEIIKCSRNGYPYKCKYNCSTKECNIFLKNPEEFIKERANLIEVRPDYEEKLVEPIGKEETDEVEIEDLIKMNEINSGKRIKFSKHNSDWVFVPANINHEENARKFEKYLKNKKLTVEDLLKNLNKVNIKIAKDIYKKLGELNTNSLVLYSGVITDSKFSKKNYCSDSELCKLFKINSKGCLHLDDDNKEILCSFCNLNFTGCLYLGDYNAKDNFEYIKKIYSNFFDNLSIIQIPHHGSKHNFDIELLKINKQAYHVISHRIKNGYKHPHEETLFSLKKLNIKFKQVTEEQNSSLTQLIG